jgi:outer membrane protein assembly factor BamB
VNKRLILLIFIIILSLFTVVDVVIAASPVIESLSPPDNYTTYLDYVQLSATVTDADLDSMNVSFYSRTPEIRSYTTGSGVESSPTVSNGYVYVGSLDDKIYQLNSSDMSLVNSYTTGDDVRSSPTVSDGYVYVGSYDDKVYQLNATDMSFVNSYTTGDDVKSSPTVSDGYVYVGSHDDKVYQLNASNMSIVNSYTTGDDVRSSPTVSGGYVYVGSYDNKVYQLNASDMSFVNSYTTGSYVRSSPTVSDGYVYVGSNDDKVYQLNASDMSLVNNYTTGSDVWSSPTVSGGYVYVGSQDDKVYQLNATDMSLVNNYTTGDNVLSSATVSDGYVYVGSWDEKVYQLNASDMSFVNSYTTGLDVWSSPTVSNGYVYVGSFDDKVYQLNANNISKNPSELLHNETNVANGTTVTYDWTGLSNDTTYSWSAEVSDQTSTTETEIQSFEVQSQEPPVIESLSPPDNYTTYLDYVQLSATVTDADLDSMNVSFYSGTPENRSYTIGDYVKSSPTVSNGYVYVGSFDNKVYQLDASDMSFVNSYTTGSLVFSSPTVSDGYVYVGSHDDKVYQLNASDMSFVNSYTTGSVVRSSPTVSDGYVYVGSEDNKVYQLNASDMSLVNSYTTGSYVYSSPTVSDGYVYVGSYDNKVYQLNATDMSFINSYTTGGNVYSSPMVSDGYVYIGSEDNKVYQLNATDMSLVNNYTTGSYVWSSPTVSGGYVYVGCADDKVYQLNATDMSLVNSYTTGDNVESSPTVSGGYVYVGSFDNKVYQLDATDMSLVNSYTTGSVVKSSPTVSDGYVYVGSYDDKVYQLNADNISKNPSELLHNETNVANGTTVSYDWTGFDDGHNYSWYAEVTDGVNTTTSEVREFTLDEQYTLISNNSSMVSVYGVKNGGGNLSIVYIVDEDGTHDYYGKECTTDLSSCSSEVLLYDSVSDLDNLLDMTYNNATHVTFFRGDSFNDVQATTCDNDLTNCNIVEIFVEGRSKNYIEVGYLNDDYQFAHHTSSGEVDPGIKIFDNEFSSYYSNSTINGVSLVTNKQGRADTDVIFIGDNRFNFVMSDGDYGFHQFNCEYNDSSLSDCNVVNFETFSSPATQLQQTRTTRLGDNVVTIYLDNDPGTANTDNIKFINCSINGTDCSASSSLLNNTLEIIDMKAISDNYFSVVLFNNSNSKLQDYLFDKNFNLNRMTTFNEETNFMDYVDINNTYYGELFVSSNTNTAVLNYVAFDVPPFIENISITPESPLSSQNLTGVCDAVDDDGDAVYYDYWWSVNDAVVATTQNLTTTDYSKDDNVTFACQANDGEQYSYNETFEVTILNTPPFMEEADVTPSEPGLDDELVADCNASDYDDDVVLYEYEWYHDGVYYANGSVLSADNTSLGSEYLVSCRGYDGDDYSDWLNSSAVQVSELLLIVNNPGDSSVVDTDSPMLNVTVYNDEGGDATVSFYNYTLDIGDDWLYNDSLVDGISTGSSDGMSVAVYQLDDDNWYATVINSTSETFTSYKIVNGAWSLHEPITSGITMPNTDFFYHVEFQRFNDEEYLFVSDGDNDSVFKFNYSSGAFESTTDYNGFDPGTQWEFDVFELDSEMYLIHDDRGPVGFKYNEDSSAWESNNTIVSGLASGWPRDGVPEAFTDENGELQLITVKRTSDVVNGYSWNGSGWDSNSTVVQNMSFDSLEDSYLNGNYVIIEGIPRFYYGYIGGVSAFEMSTVGDVALLQANSGVAHSETSTYEWQGLSKNTEYEWMVGVDNGVESVMQGPYSFTTGNYSVEAFVNEPVYSNESATGYCTDAFGTATGYSYHWEVDNTTSDDLRLLYDDGVILDNTSNLVSNLANPSSIIGFENYTSDGVSEFTGVNTGTGGGDYGTVGTNTLSVVAGEEYLLSFNLTVNDGTLNYVNTKLDDNFLAGTQSNIESFTTEGFKTARLVAESTGNYRVNIYADNSFYVNITVSNISVVRVNNTLSDDSANSNDATLRGATVASDGLEFDGVDDYGVINNDESINFGTGSFTVYVKGAFTKEGSTQEIIGKKPDDFNGAGWQLLKDSGSNFFFRIADGSNNVYSNSGGSLAADDYKKLAVVVDRAAGEFRMYNDGVLTDTVDISSVTGSVSNANDAYLMNRRGVSDYAEGLVLEVAVFDEALTTGEVQGLGMDDDELSRGYYSKGDDIRISCVATNGSENSSRVYSDYTTVSNTAPVVDEVYYEPVPPRSNETLTGHCAASDYDNDSVSYEYRWADDDGAVVELEQLSPSNETHYYNGEFSSYDVTGYDNYVVYVYGTGLDYNSTHKSYMNVFLYNESLESVESEFARDDSFEGYSYADSDGEYLYAITYSGGLEAVEYDGSSFEVTDYNDAHEHLQLYYDNGSLYTITSDDKIIVYENDEGNLSQTTVYNNVAELDNDTDVYSQKIKAEDGTIVVTSGDSRAGLYEHGAGMVSKLDAITTTGVYYNAVVDGETVYLFKDDGSNTVIERYNVSTGAFVNNGSFSMDNDSIDDRLVEREVGYWDAQLVSGYLFATMEYPDAERNETLYVINFEGEELETATNIVSDYLLVDATYLYTMHTKHDGSLFLSGDYNHKVSYFSDSLNYTSFAKGDNITFECRGFDGEDYSAYETSGSYTVLNTPPAVNNVSVTPGSFDTTDDISIVCDAVDVDDSDVISYGYEWYVNNTSAGTAQELNSTNFAKGDDIIGSCRAFDGDNYSDWVNSSVYNTGNSVPEIVSSQIIPASPKSNETLTSNCTGYDADSEELVYNQTWYVNEASVLSDNETLDTSYYSHFDNVTLECRAFDGDNYSNPLNSTIVEILNTPPIVNNISFDPAIVYGNSTVNMTCNAEDYDSDVITGYEYAWYVNGDEVLDEFSEPISYTIGDYVKSSPTVSNGYVYVGSFDNKVYQLDASDMSFVNSYTTGSLVFSSPTVSDGYVYVGSHDDKVYQLNATDMNFVNSYTTGSVVRSSPTVSDGYVYVGSQDDKVYQLNASDMSLVNNYTTGSYVYSSPTVSDGYVYVGSWDDKVYQLNASDMSLVNSYTTGDNVYSSPTVSDGYVYIGSEDNKVYQLNATDMSLVNSYTTGSYVWSSPTVSGGYVYVGCADDKVYQLNATDMSLVNSYTTGDNVESSPTVSNGYVYVGSVDNKVYQLNASDMSLVNSYTTGSVVKSSPTVSDGYVYVGSYDDKVYQLNADNISDFSYSYNNSSLTSSEFEAGDVLTGSCRASDSYDYSLWYNETSLTVLNTPPSVDNAWFEPSPPLSNESVQGYCNGTDYEDDTLNYYYEWFVNDALVSTDSFLTHDYYDKSDELVLGCQASDSNSNSTKKNSSVATVLNTPPVMNATLITPEAPRSNESASMSCDSYDYDGDGVSYEYQWEVDSVNVTTSQIITADYYNKTDTLVGYCRANDGGNYSGWLSNSTVVINTRPVVDVVTMTPSEPLSNESLTAFCNGTDYDDDSIVDKEYRWFVNGASVDTGETLNHSHTLRDDTVTLSCRVNDGEEYSDWKNSSVATVVNTPPTVELANMTTVYPEDYLKGYCEVDDYDLDDLNVTYTLRINYTEGYVALSGDPYNLSEAVYSQSINSQDSNPTGVKWNGDGTKMYEVGYNAQKIYEYDVTTPYDLSTATYSQSIPAQDLFPRDIAWNDDGTKLYEAGRDGDKIYEYDVTTPYDLSTATYSQSIPSQDGGVSGITWNDDGTKLYEVGYNDDFIIEYNLTTAYDISTAVVHQSIEAQDSVPTGIEWNDDGTRLYETGYVSGEVHQYEVTTPYDLSTATLSITISSRDSTPTGLAWDGLGERFYEVGDDGNDIHEYEVAELYYNISSVYNETYYQHPITAPGYNMTFQELVAPQIGDNVSVECQADDSVNVSNTASDWAIVRNHGLNISGMTDTAADDTEIESVVSFEATAELYAPVDECRVLVQPVNASAPFDVIEATVEGDTSINISANYTIDDEYTADYDNVSWWVYCNDTFGNYNSSASSYFEIVDITMPVINDSTFEFLSNGTVVDNVLRDSVGLNATFEDYNLFAVSVNVTCEDDGTIHYEEIVDVNTTSYTYDEDINITGYNVQRCNTTLMYSDAHTDEEIRDYDYEKTDNSISYETSNGNLITVTSLNEVSGTDTNRMVDRYNFEFEYPNNRLVYNYRVEASSKIYYLEDSNYPAHFVVWNEESNSGNWVDFALLNSQDYNYIINKRDDYSYDIVISHKVLSDDSKNYEYNNERSLLSMFDWLSREKPLNITSVGFEGGLYLEHEELTSSKVSQLLKYKDYDSETLSDYSEVYGLKSIKFNSIGGTNIATSDYYFFIGGVFNVTSNDYRDDTSITNYTVDIYESGTGDFVRSVSSNTSSNVEIGDVAGGDYYINITHPQYITKVYNESMVTQYSDCEQGLANETVACGAASAGNYAFSDSGYFTDYENMFDGNTSTYSVLSTTDYEYLYANYTVPENASFATWRVYAFGDSKYKDLELETGNKTVLQLRIAAKTGFGNSNIKFQEYNGTDWNMISYLSPKQYDSKIFDEYMLWKFKEENVVDINYNTSQTEITYIFKNVKTRNAINNYNVTFESVDGIDSYTYEVGNGTDGVTLPFRAETEYNVTFSKDGYMPFEDTYEFDYKDVETIEVFVGYQLNLNFYNEKTLEPFDFNETSSATLEIFCDDRTDTYDLLNNTIDVNITCEYSKFRFNLQYPTSVDTPPISYYRKRLMPFDDALNESVYLLQATENAFVYSSFALDDLLGRYENPSIWIKKKTDNGTVVIQSDYSDIESKTGAYLIENDEYIIEVHSTNNPIQVIGDYDADFGEDKIISLYNINLDSGDKAHYQDIDFVMKPIVEDNETNVLFSYEDSNNGTESITFRLYENTLNGTLIYESEPYYNMSSVGAVKVPLGAYENTTLVSEIEIVHSSYGNQKFNDRMNKNWNLRMPLQDHVPQSDLNWFILILISVIAIYGTVNNNILSLALSGVTVMFIIFGWSTVALGMGIFAVLIALVELLLKQSSKSSR